MDLNIVHLGDSYSSGLGATDSYGTTVSECYRSTQGWGGQYADRLKAQNEYVTYSNVACVGAKSHALLNANLIAQNMGTLSLSDEYGRSCLESNSIQMQQICPTTNQLCGYHDRDDSHALFLQILLSCTFGDLD